MERIGAAVWGTGRAGQELVRAGLPRPWLDFRAGIVTSAAKDGLDLGAACGLGEHLDAPVSTDVDAVLARPDVDVVFYAGLGTPAEVAAACGRVVEAGKDAITVSGLVHPATVLGTDGAAALDEVARRSGRRILGTGVWDYLTVTLPLASVSSVSAFDELLLERVADTSAWGHGVLRDEGVGGPPESAGAGFVMRNYIVESTMLIAESLGVAVLGEPAFTSEPVLSEVRRERGGYVVEAGTVGGHRRRLVAELEGGGRIVTVWRGMFDLDRDRDGLEPSAAVELTGSTAFRVHLTGGLFDDTYPPTGARAVAAVRPLRTLPPGLHTADELGVRPVYR